MKQKMDNYLNCERGVEVEFVIEKMTELHSKNSSAKILDVGGIPTKKILNQKIYDFIKSNRLNYTIADFRKGKYNRYNRYKGDFVTMTIPEKFDAILFLSSLEHFPQCTERFDMTFRPDEDKKGFAKAVTLLEEKGQVWLTVPFGKPLWQDYHQNYDMGRIKFISEGTKLIETYTYRLIDNSWVAQEPETMGDVLYTGRAFGVGCFVFEKL